jgi:hypothetical protein
LGIDRRSILTKSLGVHSLASTILEPSSMTDRACNMTPGCLSLGDAIGYAFTKETNAQRFQEATVFETLVQQIPEGVQCAGHNLPETVAPKVSQASLVATAS